jgi:hypothetical protein
MEQAAGLTMMERENAEAGATLTVNGSFERAKQSFKWHFSTAC